MKKKHIIIIAAVYAAALAAALISALLSKSTAGWASVALCAALGAVLAIEGRRMWRGYKTIEEGEMFIRRDMGLQRLLRGESTPQHMDFNRQWTSGGGDIIETPIFPENGFCVVNFSVDDYDDLRMQALHTNGVIKHPNMNSEDIACILIREAAQREFAAARLCSECTTIDWDVFGILNFACTEYERANTLYVISQCCSAVLEKLEREHGAVISCAVSSIAVGIEKVPELYDEVVQICSYRRMLSVSSRLLLFNEMSIEGPNSGSGDPARYHAPDSVYVIKQYRVFINCMIAHDYISARAVIKSIISSELSDANPYIEFAQYKLHSVINMLISAFDYVKEDIPTEQYSRLFPAMALTDVKTAGELSVKVDKIFEVFIEYGGRTLERTAPEWVAKMKEYIDENYTDPDLNINIVAMHFSLNPAYASRSFKMYADTGILDYIHSLRIAEAKKLLAQGLNVKETAARAGFGNTRSMNRSFQKYEGVSPRQSAKSDIL